jgi:hypothetical protein
LCSRTAGDIAAPLGVSDHVAELSLHFSSIEEFGGFRTVSPFCAFAVLVELMTALGYVLFARWRAAREREYAGRIVGYLQQNAPKSRSIGHICKSLKITATPRTQHKLLGDLNQTPNLDSMSVTQTMKPFGMAEHQVSPISEQDKDRKRNIRVRSPMGTYPSELRR